MSYDIYGNSLRRGHCEVHPHVHEEYPCSVCIQKNNNRNAHKQSESDHYEIMRLEHELELSKQRIAELEQESSSQHNLVMRQHGRLTKVANALRGEPDELSPHSHHDLIDVAHRLVRERGELAAKIKDLESQLNEHKHWLIATQKSKNKLAAHVERFNSIMADIRDDCDCGGEYDDDPIPSVLWDLYRETPQATLAERDAEVARKAFIAGYELAESAMEGQFIRAHNVDGFANKYAERVRRGES